MSEWISVKDRLPKVSKEVWVWVIYKRIKGRPRYETHTESWIENDGTWAVGSAKKYEVTHWMPLPAPPLR